MTEAQSNPPTIVREVKIGDAVYALTAQNAIFRNGRQLVIPHLGVDFITELMAALATDEFVAGIVENHGREPVMAPVGPCDAVEPGVGTDCELRSNHEGPHRALIVQGLNSGSFVTWHDHPEPEVAPSRDEFPFSIHWYGFDVRSVGDSTTASVHHTSSLVSHAFPSSEAAHNALNSGTVSEYERLCARAYLAWIEANWPAETGREENVIDDENWMDWEAGDVVYNSDGRRGLVFDSTGDSFLLLGDENGTVIEVREVNAQVLEDWKVGLRTGHDFNKEG